MECDNFYTLQPEWKKILKNYRYKLIPSSLNANIQLIYLFSSTMERQEMLSLPGIPDGCLDIIFNMNGDKNDCYLIPSPEKRMNFQYKTGRSYLGIRLKPLHSVHGFEMSLKDINGFSILPLFDIAPKFIEFYEQLLFLRTYEERSRFILSSKLFNSGPSNLKQFELIKNALACIYLQKGTITTKVLERELCYTQRYIRILFNEMIGTCPKKFIQITQLQSVINMMEKDSFSLNGLLDNDFYYDASHFYKTFKKYMDMTPNDYLRILKAN